jgi:DNA polymerase I-like protein with 3'-5' exonuclease and polymerase domains
MFQVANIDGEVTSFRGKVNTKTRQVTYDNCKSELRWLKAKIANPKTILVAHNVPFEYRMTTQRDLAFEWNCQMEDTAVRWRLVYCDEMTYGLKPLTKKHFDFPDDDEKALNKALTKARRAAKARGWTIATVDTHGKKTHSKADYWLPELEDLCRAYGESDPIRCILLWRYSEDFFRENKREGGRIHEVYRGTYGEQKLMRALLDAERYGFTYKRRHGQKLHVFYTKYRAEHKAKLTKLLKPLGFENLNHGSTKQLQALFIHKLKYEHLWKTDAGNPKIDAEQLMVWARGSYYKADIDGDAPDGCKISRELLEIKAADKVLEYLDSYEHFSCQRADGSICLHPAWKQAGALTGRQSCTDPNMQQIASAETSRRRANVRPRQREAFGPRPGYLWYMPDYSQIEVWIFAALANDKAMLHTLISGTDLHLRTARRAWEHLREFCTCGRWQKIWAAILKKDTEPLIKWDVEKQLHDKKCMIRFWRMRAKEILFSRMYGGGNRMVGKIAFMMRKGLKAGKEFIRQFDEAMPGVKNFIRNTIDDVEQTGVMINCFGREYRIDRKWAYKTVNYAVQGSAADVLKRAAVRIYNLLKRKYPRSHLIGTIHDEFVLEIHERDHSPRLMREVLDCMQADSHLIPNLPKHIKLPVALKITNTRWNEARDVAFLKRAA